MESPTEALENIALCAPSGIDASAFEIKRTIVLKPNHIVADLALIVKESECALPALFESEPQVVNAGLELGSRLPASDGIFGNVEKVGIIAVRLGSLWQQ